MNVGPLHTLILSAAPPLNHYYIPLPQLLWAGAHNFEGVSPLHSALPDKAINLFFFYLTQDSVPKIQLGTRAQRLNFGINGRPMTNVHKNSMEKNVSKTTLWQLFP